jgi:hypothetical protein
MTRCDQCGNAYGHTFSITMSGSTYNFDCFECAIEMLAPRCFECNTRVIGHGVEKDARIFCCAHCARMEGVIDLTDHAVTEELTE